MVKKAKKKLQFEYPSGFRFLDLPAELRVEVYKYLLPQGIRIDISCHMRLVRWCRSNRPLWIVGSVMAGHTKGLFLVNRLVGAEAKGNRSQPRLDRVAKVVKYEV